MTIKGQTRRRKTDDSPPYGARRYIGVVDGKEVGSCLALSKHQATRVLREYIRLRGQRIPKDYPMLVELRDV